MSETASAAIRGSTIPGSIDSISSDSIIGECADGSPYRSDKAWVKIASTPPQGLTMPAAAVEVILMEFGGDGDDRRDGDGVGLAGIGADPVKEVPEVVDAPGRPPRGRVLGDQLDRRVEHDDPRTVEPVAGPRCIDGVDCRVGVGDLVVAVDHHQARDCSGRGAARPSPSIAGR